MISLFFTFILLLAITGIYCVLVSYNLVRALLGIEIMIKSATLSIIFSGYYSGNVALAQAMVITLIVIEVVLMVVVGGIILWVFRHNQTIDASLLRKLKG